MTVQYLRDDNVMCASVWFECFGGLFWSQNPWYMGGKCDNKECNLKMRASISYGFGIREKEWHQGGWASPTVLVWKSVAHHLILNIIPNYFTAGTRPMVGENQQLVTNEPVGFEK